MFTKTHGAAIVGRERLGYLGGTVLVESIAATANVLDDLAMKIRTCERSLKECEAKTN